MKSLKCPKCGNVFQVDEADYASIVSQVRNEEFDAELSRRVAELHERQKTEQELATAKTEKTFQAQLSRKDVELGAQVPGGGRGIFQASEGRAGECGGTKEDRATGRAGRER